MAYRYPYDEEEKKYEAPKTLTNRRMWKLMLFGFLTLEIYNIIFFYRAAKDMNTVIPSRKRSPLMNYILALFFGLISASLALWAWHYQLADRVEEGLRDRKIRYDFETGDFWSWFFFGSLFLVGPYIYYHKLCKALNLLCQSYNENPELNA